MKDFIKGVCCSEDNCEIKLFNDCVIVGGLFKGLVIFCVVDLC